MKLREKLIHLVLLSICLTAFGGQPRICEKHLAQADAMIAEINGRRAANGLPPYSVNGALMAAAQAHSEYQASIGSATHTGAGGTRPADRAAAAGYGNGAQIFVSENIYATTSASPAVAVDWWIADGGWHLEGVLSSKYTDMGVGVAVAGGIYYYTLDVGYVAGTQSQSTTGSSGSGSLNPTQLAAQQATQAAQPKPVFVATPAADGSVIHVVQQGQTLWTIAAKYNIPLADLLSRNNLTENSFVYPGNRLIIFPSNTPAPENTDQKVPTEISNQPTVAPATLLPSPTINLTATPTKTPLKKQEAGFKLDPMRALLALLIGLIAIAAVILLSFTKDAGDGT